MMKKLVRSFVVGDLSPKIVYVCSRPFIASRNQLVVQSSEMRTQVIELFFGGFLDDFEGHKLADCNFFC
jgi:hypothetical protein